MTPLLRGCARLTLVSVALLAHKFRPEAAADPRLRREALDLQRAARPTKSSAATQPTC